MGYQQLWILETKLLEANQQQEVACELKRA
jgi:hypothetical protein